MPKREVIEVTTGVWVATSRLYQTASTFVAKDGNALLIDPAWTPDELEGLTDTITHLGLTVTSGFSTHAHHDHLLWHPRYGEPPRWATRRTVELVESEHAQLVAQLGENLAAALGDSFARVSPLTDNVLPEPFGPHGPQ